jgi:hypothetical protein
MIHDLTEKYFAFFQLCTHGGRQRLPRRNAQRLLCFSELLLLLRELSVSVYTYA